MSAAPLPEVFVYVGAIGVLQFVSLAFSTRQLRGVTVAVRLGRRMSSPLARHAQPFAALSAALLLVGIVLHV